MEYGQQKRETVPPLNIDGLVYALEIAGDSDQLDTFLFVTIPIYYSDRLVEIYEKLTSNPSSDVRKIAAVGVEQVMMVDEEAGLEFAARLLQDKDREVVERVKGTVRDAANADDLPISTLDKFAKLSERYT